jgi:pimeloyl-ACP methyl ester carboxylesterase
MPSARRVTVAGGVALHVTRWDGDAAVPFLLVHGLASNARTWERVADRLAELGHPVATVDLRGHGRSDKPDDGYDFGTLCADLLAVLAEVGFDRPVVAGQSTGGNLAVDLAARAPDRLAGVAGVDGGALEIARRWPEWEGCLVALAPPRLEGSAARLVEDRLRAAHDDWSDWAIEATMANFEHLPEGVIRPWLRFERHVRILRSLWEHRPSQLIPCLEVPVLLVNADSGDGWTDHKREMAEELLEAAPMIRIEWMVGDHDLHVQHPRELADILHRSF